MKNRVVYAVCVALIAAVVAAATDVGAGKAMKNKIRITFLGESGKKCDGCIVGDTISNTRLTGNESVKVDMNIIIMENFNVTMEFEGLDDSMTEEEIAAEVSRISGVDQSDIIVQKEYKDNKVVSISVFTISEKKAIAILVEVTKYKDKCEDMPHLCRYTSIYASVSERSLEAASRNGAMLCLVVLALFCVVFTTRE